MKTRKQYMNNEINHHDYYSQFITEDVKKHLEMNIGKEKILKSKDEHFNDIKLELWDNLYLPTDSAEMVTIANGHEVKREGHKVTMCYSLSDKVCIYKTLAKTIRDSVKV